MDEQARLALEVEERARNEEEQRIQEMLSSQNEVHVQEPMMLPDDVPNEVPDESGFISDMNIPPPTIDLPEEMENVNVPAMQPVDYNVQPTPVYQDFGMSQKEALPYQQQTSYQSSSPYSQPTIVSPIVYDTNQPLQPPAPEIGYGNYSGGSASAAAGAGGAVAVALVIVVVLFLVVILGPLLIPCVIFVCCVIIVAIAGSVGGSSDYD